ncbi:MAG: hypothetical protein HYZ36_05360 [Pedosphaera parvula]|nr:hypothetical protein [Pedosphaera parvula]
MNKLICALTVAGIAAVSGCGKKEPAAVTSTSAKPVTGAMPSLGAPAEAPPPAAVGPLGAPAPAAMPVAASIPGGTNGLVLLVDQNGKAQTAEQLLNRALEIYCENMGRPHPKDLNELVQAKVLQSIPAAPQGKKWVFDPKQGKIVPASL